MRLPKDTSDDSPLNLTAMIDVLFILLIFFLVATQLHSEEKDTRINLPDTHQAEPLTVGVQPIIVNITREGIYSIAGSDYAESQVAEILHNEKISNPHRAVQIRADRDAPFKFPVAVIGMCKLEDMAYTCAVLEN